MDYVIARTHVVDHERFLEAGSQSRDLWLWGLLYAGKHESDGSLPMSAVLASPWGYGGKANIKAANKLVEVGLWDRTDKGFQILKWTEMGNKTKAQLEAAREAARKKKAGQRVRLSPPVDVVPPKDCPPVCPEGTDVGTTPVVPNSTSTSLSFSGSREGMQGETDAAPEWFAMAIETVEASTGEKIRPADSWLRYSGHRIGKGRPRNQQDAVYWLTTVMVPEARKERRQEADKRERDAKFDKERATQRDAGAKAPYHQIAKPPPSETRATAKEAAEAMRKLTETIGKTGT